MRTIIVGAGAAGLMAAGYLHGEIIVLEGNEKPGKKLYITGKGRCNVTNDCTPSEFLVNVVTNSKFLFSSIYGFTPADTRELLSGEGVPTKTERGNRVFPVSDKSSDIIRALSSRAERNGARFIYNERVIKAEKTSGNYIVTTEKNSYTCDNLIIATGGKSYPATGSTGDGYAFAKAFGHTVITPAPSLVPLITKQDVSHLSGLTLKNVNVKISAGGKEFSQFGEMLFTHDGVSGPAVLRLSAFVNRMNMPMKLSIDLKPALSEEVLDKRLMSDFAENANKQLKNSLDKLLPKALIEPIINQSELPPDKKVNILTKQERQKLLYSLKNFTFDITGKGAFESAIITAGGVSVKEINPKTMESKLSENLYFIGEVLDADALTGGYNIQIAFSTAYAAAKAINEKIKLQTEK